MNGGQQQQAYDRGITIFSPDGRLYQVEYAREAVKQGAPSVGVRTDEGVVLAAHKPSRSPLVEGDSVEKLHHVDEHAAAATAGHAADGRRLVDIARRAAQSERLRYGERATVESISTAIADHVQEHTQTGGARPYGVALLLAGVDPEGDAHLWETDPSGTPYEWQATAVGRGERDIIEYFEDEYEAGLALDDGLDLAVAGLSQGAEDLTADDVAAVTVTADGQDHVGESRLAEALDALGDDADDESDDDA